MVARRQLTADLRAPVGHVPLEAADGDLARADQRDQAGVLGENEPVFGIIQASTVGAARTTTIGAGGVDGVVSRGQDEGDALLRDEEELVVAGVVVALILGLAWFLRHRIQMMDLRKGLVDAPAQTAEDEDVEAMRRSLIGRRGRRDIEIILTMQLRWLPCGDLRGVCAEVTQTFGEVGGVLVRVVEDGDPVMGVVCSNIGAEGVEVSEDGGGELGFCFSQCHWGCHGLPQIKANKCSGTQKADLRAIGTRLDGYRVLHRNQPSLDSASDHSTGWRLHPHIR